MTTSVDRAVEVIKLIAQRPQYPAEIADSLGVHRSTIVRLLHTLEAHGFARRADAGGWTLGFEMVALGQRNIDSISIRDIARPHLLRLSDRVRHTIHLAALAGADVVYADKIDARVGAQQMKSQIGSSAIIHTAGVAKAIMAFAPDHVQAQALARCTFERYTPTTITSAPDLAREFALIRRRGWAVDDGEYEDWINCIAVPIFDSTGHAIAGISITALRALASVDDLQDCLGPLITARDAVSKELGWVGTAALGPEIAS